MNCSQLLENLTSEAVYNLTSMDLIMTKLRFTNACDVLNDSNQYTNLYLTIQISNIILMYVSPCILFFGLIGNLISFIVLQSQRKKVSTYFYLSFLSVMDFAVLLTGLTGIWGKQLAGKHVQDISDLTCKLSIFFGHLFSDVSVWLIIAVTVERFIVVTYPFRTLSSKRIRQAKYVCIGIVAIICVINFHFLVLAEIQVKNGVGKCEIVSSSSKLIHNIWPWIDAAVYSFLPFTILMVLNSFIIRSICKSKGRRKLLMPIYHKKSESPLVSKLSKDNRKTTIMLFAVSSVFLVTTLPMNVALILNTFWNNSINRSSEDLATLQLLYVISKMLMYINHSINFVLYCALGKKFRKALIKIACIRCTNRPFNHTKRLSSHTFITLENGGIRHMTRLNATKRWV